MSKTVNREETRRMLRNMFPDLDLRFEGEPDRASDRVLAEPTVVELSSDELLEEDSSLASLNALDRLERLQGRLT